MGKYAIVIALGIALVLALLWFNAWMLKRGGDEPVLEEVEGLAFDAPAIDVRRVVVTEGDSLFHDPTCAWVGSDRRTMSMDKAEKQGFTPCPQCLGEE